MPNEDEVKAMIEGVEDATATLIEKGVYEAFQLLRDYKNIEATTELSYNGVRFGYRWEIIKGVYLAPFTTPKTIAKYEDIVQKMLKYPISLDRKGRKEAVQILSPNTQDSHVGFVERLKGVFRRPDQERNDVM